MKKEIQNHLYSLRFQIAFGLIVIIFITGTVASIKSHASKSREYTKYTTELRKVLQEKAEENATLLAIYETGYLLKPRSNTFISDCKEKYFPNRFLYTAFYVLEFDQHQGSVNPFLNNFQELNWSFITTILISFVVLLFTFDGVSGEKELHTLAVTLSNPVSRSLLLLGKYLSAVFLTLLIALVGMLISLLIITLSQHVALTPAMLFEIGGFLTITSFFVFCMAGFGLLASVLVRKSNVSLLLAITFWLLFVVVIPNTAIFWANKLFPIEPADVVEARIEKTWRDIANSARQGTWDRHPQRPFFPHHEWRAQTQTAMWDAIMDQAHAYYRDMFNQLERTRKFTLVSPVSLFEYMNESVVGGGYLRFQNVWDDLHGYQTQLLNFFRALDAQDPDSPHWFNPRENLSTTRKPISFDQVPIFEERQVTLVDRFSFLKNYLIVMIIYIGVIFFLTFVLFVRYDVR